MASAVTALKSTDDHRPPHISEAEWDLRLQLAAAYRVFDHLGWTLLIFNHISLRVPGPEHHFLINPYGLRYDEVTASNLVKIGLDGEKVEDSPWGVNPAGFLIHSAIHENVPEAMCIMHTHTNEGLAVACKKDGLTQTNFYSAMLHGHIAYHDFEGLTVRDDERPRLVKSIGSKSIVILRNHGLLTHGRNVAECFRRMWTLQKACEAQVMYDSMSGDVIEVSDEAAVNSTRDARLFGNEPPDENDQAFDALIRVIDAKDPSWRT